jgi:hypothetical protein
MSQKSSLPQAAISVSQVLMSDSGFGRIFKIGEQSINAQITAYYNVVTPKDTGANWQLRAEWTFLFPTK